MDVLTQISRLLAPVQRRLRTLLVRGEVRAVDDTAPIQTLDVGALGEQRAGLARMAEYGLASHPPPGAEAIVASIGGDWGRGVVIATDDRARRPTGLAEGECCLWTPDHGRRVHCRSDGHVDLGSSPEDYVALAALVRTELDAIKKDLDAIKQWAATHIHNVPAMPASPPTLPPVPSVPSANPLTLTWSPADVAAEEVRAK